MVFKVVSVMLMLCELPWNLFLANDHNPDEYQNRSLLIDDFSACILYEGDFVQ